jgi:hypothetical protein
MPFSDLIPAYRPAAPARPRVPYARVEPTAPVRGLRRHDRLGSDGAAYTFRALPPHRGRFVDIFV